MKRLLVLVGVFAVFSCSGKQSKEVGGKLSVAATILPVADIVRYVGGDYVSVYSIVSGMDNPHTFAVSPGVIKKVSSSDVFFEIGMGLEPWAKKVEENTKAKVITLADKVPVKIGGNPHIWLSVDNITNIAFQIADALSHLKPSLSSVFKRNADEFSKKIVSVFRRYRNGIDSLKKKSVVVDLPAFDYLMKDLGVEVADVIIRVPGSETSGKRVLEIVKLMKEKDVRVVVHNILFSRKVPSIVAEQVGGVVVDLTPMPGVLTNARHFVDMIEYDCESLYNALKKFQ